MSEKVKNPDCPCPNRDCPRNGYCEECQAFHHASGGLTRCERIAAAKEAEAKA